MSDMREMDNSKNTHNYGYRDMAISQLSDTNL